MEFHFFVHPADKCSMNIRIYFLFIVLTVSNWAKSQSDSVFVLFSITDKLYKEAIPNVNATIELTNRTLLKTSSPRGTISFYAPMNASIHFKLSHPLYDPVEGVKKISNFSSEDTLFIDLEMIQIQKRVLKEVVVKAPGVPDTIFMSSRLSVSDFEIQKDGSLVLLAYPKQLKKGSELLLYDGQEVTSSFHVQGVAEELVRDYRGNAHVVCADNVYGIHVSPNKIGISTLEKDYFLKYLAPILDTNHTKLYFSNFSKDYPAFNYFAFDQLDSAYSRIIHIEDELMMELYRSEYKWVDVRTKLWAKNKELETGVDAEIWVGANYFTQSLYYKELYAPLFQKNDTIYVFDYYKDKLYSFDVHGNLLDSIAIYHHYQPKSTGWKKQLIQDRVTGQVYALFERAGYSYLGLIDLKTGLITEKFLLEFRYVDKILIHDNFVYYVYRPFESTQKKFLYREKMPYQFVTSKVPYGIETSIDTGR